MPTVTIPGVQGLGGFLLSTPTIVAGDIVLVAGGSSTNLPFAFREAGQPIIDITMTDAQFAGQGVLVVRDASFDPDNPASDPKEWDGPNPVAGPFDCFEQIALATETRLATANDPNNPIDFNAIFAAGVEQAIATETDGNMSLDAIAEAVRVKLERLGGTVGRVLSNTEVIINNPSS